MITTTIPTTAGGGTVKMPSRAAVYMYSPFPVIVSGTTHDRVTMTVYVGDESYFETRRVFDGEAQFDLSRIVQLLAPDVSTIFEMNLSQDGEACPYVLASMELLDTEGNELALFEDLICLYGTLDQGESRFMDATRRVWLNYPTTVMIGDELCMSGDYIDGDFYPNLSLPSLALPLVEMNLQLHLGELGGKELRDALLRGVPAEVSFSIPFNGMDTIEDAATSRTLKLIPDLTPLGAGTYLRWLNRDGTFGYWLFKNGVLQATAAQHSTFARFVPGNPAEALNGRYRNSVVGDFAESRQLTLGTVANSDEEYDYLLGLATSPVVDLFIEDTKKWQRVNVAAASYPRNRKFNTPNRQNFEISIILPARNTVTL